MWREPFFFLATEVLGVSELIIDVDGVGVGMLTFPLVYLEEVYPIQIHVPFIGVRCT